MLPLFVGLSLGWMDGDLVCMYHVQILMGCAVAATVTAEPKAIGYIGRAVPAGLSL